MRMWMVDPQRMCRKHLLGEHVEMHMLAASMIKGRSIQGFLDNDLLEPQNIVDRHAAIAAEICRRGYSHKSELQDLTGVELPVHYIDRTKSLNDLVARCPDCASLNKQLPTGERSA